MRPLTRFALALPLLAAPTLLLAASSPVAGDPIAASIARATAEAQAAEAKVERLEELASAAKGEAEQLHARQAAAAEAIAAAEARISAADARSRLIAAEMEARRQRLAKQQAPAASLMAGLALMASRPPLLAVLDQGSIDEFVRVRLLLDSTLPAIRSRTAALRSEIERGRALQENAEAAQVELARRRGELETRKRAFAELEARALQLAELRSGQALGAGDVALARSEEAGRLQRQAGDRRATDRIAAELAALAAPPARPVPPAGMAERAEAPRYLLPSSAAVLEGLGSVSANGVRSRGLTLDTRRGAAVAVPASGIVRFSGPFRSYDGIVIIDHGDGWMTLIVNVSSPLERGARVRIGEPLGRALGPLGVELSHNGNRVSPALIAGSSEPLSNGRQRS